MRMPNIAIPHLIIVTVFLSSCCPSNVSQTQPTASPIATSQSENWRTYKADSGYEIQYPLETYSMRSTLDARDRSEIVYPGPKTLEPNDSFYYQMPEAVTYKISISVVSNDDRGWSLENNAEQLLAENPIHPYNKEALAGCAIQTTKLGDENAIQVDEVKEGPIEITTQIATIHNGFIYSVLVEPQGMPYDQRYTLWPTKTENREIYQKILETFEFEL